MDNKNEFFRIRLFFWDFQILDFYSSQLTKTSGSEPLIWWKFQACQMREFGQIDHVVQAIVGS